MLHPTTRERLLRALLSEPGRRWDHRSLSERTHCDYSRVTREAHALVAARYLHPRTLVLTRPHDLLQFFALGWHVEEVEVSAFEVAERAEYWVSKMGEIAAESGLRYALTGLAAAQVLAPSAVPVTVQAYVDRDQRDAWARALDAAGAYPAEDRRGGRVQLLLWPHADYGAREVRGVRVVSLPQLYADLHAPGGLLRSAAERVREAWDVRPA